MKIQYLQQFSNISWLSGPPVSSLRYSPAKVLIILVGWSSSQTRSQSSLDESLDTKQYPWTAGPSGDSYISVACLKGEETMFAIDLLDCDSIVLSTQSSVKTLYQW